MIGQHRAQAVGESRAAHHRRLAGDQKHGVGVDQLEHRVDIAGAGFAQPAGDQSTDRIFIAMVHHPSCACHGS